MRPNKTGVLECNAWCDTCGWESGYASNSVGNAAQHAQRTGHKVHADQTVHIVWNG